MNRQISIDEPFHHLNLNPEEDWATVEEEVHKFWVEIAVESELKAKVVGIFKEYNETMVKAGKPYRYS